MASPRKNLQQPTDEDGFMSLLTTGQLVIAISVSLCYGLACFLLGVLVGKYDSSLRPPEPVQQVVSADTGAAAPLQQPEAAPLQKRQSIQTSPRPDVLQPAAPASKPHKTTRPDPTVHEPVREEAEAKPDTPAVAAVEAPAEEAEAAPQPPRKDKEESGPALTVSAPPATQQIEAMVPYEQPELPKMPSSTLSNRPAPNPEAASAAAALPSTTQQRGDFGVQVASFLGSERKKKALDFQRLMRDNAGMECVIFPSDDDQYHRVVIVGFDSRASAEKACAELRKKPEFADAFIKALPK